ncbi:MAG: hypothetical protein KKF44_07020 [Nanoarchaeota archaeon]|nr:hypothetical protein [Nanoarchaeota archaeon]
MIEFNPDGSLKLPGSVQRSLKEKEQKMKTQRCIKIEREIVNFTAPKKCILHLTLSDAITDNRFAENIYKDFLPMSTVLTKFFKKSENEFDVEIDTDFRRCTDCQGLINRYREFMDLNIIEVKGICTFSNQRPNFSYEDYFD